MRTENRPPGATGRTAGGKLERSLVLRQPSVRCNPFPSEIRRSLAEFEKCSARFDDADTSTVSLAVMGISLIAQELLHLCQQYQNDLSEQGGLGDA